MAKIGNLKLGEDVNTNGISVSIYFTSCDFNCKNCFNKEFQDYEFGTDYTEDTENYILNYVRKNYDYINSLAILGGEPLHKNNYETVLNLCKRFKKEFSEKEIWLWTGNLYENIKMLEIMKFVDYVIDGLYDEKLNVKDIKYRGSSNQRVFKNGKLILDKDI